jgi:hypothetical protein
MISKSFRAINIESQLAAQEDRQNGIIRIENEWEV